MNQIINIAGTATTIAAAAYARKLAMEGKNSSQIGIMCRAAGWRITDQDAVEIWNKCQAHNEAFRKALGT